MAYHPILQNYTYAPKPYQAETPAELARLAMEEQRADDAAKMAALDQASKGMANTGEGMKLEEQQALHPPVMAALAQERDGSAQGQPQQAPADPNDPYARQQALASQGQSLADYASGHPVLLSRSPELTAIQAEKEKALAAQTANAGTQFGLRQQQDFNTILPSLEQIKQRGLAAMKGAPTSRSVDAYNAMVGGVQSALVSQAPHLINSKAYQDYMKDLEKFKPTPQPNAAVISMQPPPSSTLDNAARRIANHESTVSEEINKGRFAGAQAMQIHDELVNRVRAIDPNFSEADSEAGYAFGKNPSTRRAISQLDNAYSTLDRLKSVYAGLNNGQFPTVNKALNAGALQLGDVESARAAIAEVLGNDELTQAFSRGGMGSDKLRDMSSKLANYNLSPQQMAAQFDEIMHGLERSRNAYVGQGAGYIKPMEKKGAEPSVKPYDDPAKEARYQAWKKANGK